MDYNYVRNIHYWVANYIMYFILDKNHGSELCGQEKQPIQQPIQSLFTHSNLTQKLENQANYSG